MVHLSKLVTDVRFDLDDYTRDDFFRAYTTDLSLLMAMKDFSLKQHIVENTLEGNSKGGIYEYAITDALYKNGYRLCFYKNETTKREIDVVIQKDGNIGVGEDGIITLPLYMIAFISFIHLPRLASPQIWERVLPALRPAAFWDSRSFCMFLR